MEIKKRLFIDDISGSVFSYEFKEGFALIDFEVYQSCTDPVVLLKEFHGEEFCESYESAMILFKRRTTDKFSLFDYKIENKALLGI